MGGRRTFSFLALALAGLAALLLVFASPAAAGDTWQTATVVDAPIISQPLHLNASEQAWYQVPRSGTQVFNSSIFADTLLDVEYLVGDASSGPSVLWRSGRIDPALSPSLSSSIPWFGEPVMFVRLQNPASDPGSLNGTNVTLTLGAFEPRRLVSGDSLLLHMEGWGRSSGSFSNYSLVFNNSLLGASDGLWQLRVTIVSDDSNVTGHNLSITGLCLAEPRCSPNDLPPTYSCHVFVPAPCNFPHQMAFQTLIWGNGSTFVGSMADNGRGLTYLAFGGYWPVGGMPLDGRSDITFWVNVTQGSLPARNADDDPAGAHNVTNHQASSGALSQATNLEDWYAFDAPGVPLLITASLSGATYTDGSNRNGYLLLITEMFLYNSTMHMLAADHSMLDRSNFNCINCVAGSNAILLSVPGTIPAGERLYISFHILQGGGMGTLDSAAYNLTIPLPNRAPQPVAGNGTFAFDEDTFGYFDMNSMFTDADGDSFVFYVGYVSGLQVLTNVNGNNLTLTPPQDGIGEALLTVTANDRWPNGMTLANLTITVRPVNDAPAKMGPPRAVEWSQQEPSPAFNVTAFFADVDGDALAFSLELPPEIGYTSCGPGCFIMQALSDDTWGNFSGLIFAADPSGLNATLGLSITIVHVNRAPVALGSAPAEMSMTGGTTPTLLQATDFCKDPDLDPITFTLWAVDPTTHPFATSRPPGVNDQMYLAASDPDAEGVWVVTLSCTDPSSARALMHLNVTVRPANLAPRFLSRLPADGTLDFAENSSTTFMAAFGDPEGLELAYFWQVDGRIVGGAATNSTTVSFDFAAAGSHTVTLEATDPGGKSAETTWVIQVTNVDRPPTCSIVAVDGLTADAGDAMHFSGVAQDADGDSLSYVWSVSGLQKGTAVDLVMLMPDVNATLQLRVSAGPGSASCSVDLRVNPPPPPAPPPINNTTEPPPAKPSPGFEAVASASAMAAAALAAFVSRRRRARP